MREIRGERLPYQPVEADRLLVTRAPLLGIDRYDERRTGGDEGAHEPLDHRARLLHVLSRCRRVIRGDAPGDVDAPPEQGGSVATADEGHARSSRTGVAWSVAATYRRSSNWSGASGKTRATAAG